MRVVTVTQIAREKENKSGGAGMHSWRFCGNKLTNQLMMDWLDIRSGGEECILTKQYLDAAVDMESGAGFNTFDEKDEVSSDSDDDHGKDNPSAGHKRGRGKRKSPDDDSKGKKRREGDFNTGIARLEKMGEAMLKKMGSSAVEVRVACDARVMETGDAVDALEMKLATFKSMPECTPDSLQRVEMRLKIAIENYEDAVHARDEERKNRS